MSVTNGLKKPLSSSAAIFFLLIIAVFVMEVSVKEFLSVIFSGMNPLPEAVSHAGAMTLLYLLPLWKLFVVPLFHGRGFDRSMRRDSFQFLVKGAGIIFLVELLVTVSIPQFFPALEPDYFSIIDASLDIAVCSPLLWWLLFRPACRERRVRFADFLEKPVKLYLMLLFVVFIGDFAESFILPIFLPYEETVARTIVDNFVFTLVSAPFLWLLIMRPLQEALSSEKRRSDTIQAQVIDAVVSVDEEGTIASFNPAAEMIFGFSADEAIGNRVTRLLCDNEQQLGEMIREAFDLKKEASSLPLSREVTLRRRDGSPLIMDLSVSRVLLGGRQSFMIIMRDITGRKETEKALNETLVRFRQLFEQTEDAIFFFKPGTCRVIDVNLSAEKLYGYTKEELLEMPFATLCSPEHFPLLEKCICSIHGGEMAPLDNIVNYRKDGTEIVVSMRGKVITLQGIEIVYCTFRDISERMRLEKEAREIQANLIQANKMTSLGLMVSGVAHEINNPNNYVLANLQFMERVWRDAILMLRERYRENGEFLIGGIPFSQLDEQAASIFAGMSEGAKRINEIVQTLKSFARQEKIASDQQVDINGTINAAISILHHEIVKYTENFHAELEDNIPPVIGNNQQLGQVIINLLLNACQALPSRKSGVSISTGYDDATEEIFISIRDEGVGVSEEMGRKIMEPFFTTKLDSGGTGLGLAISNSIIKDHKGAMDFISEEGKGTTFTVRIPAAPPMRRRIYSEAS